MEDEKTAADEALSGSDAILEGDRVEPVAKKKRRKWPVVAGVVAVVLVAAGAGFWVWHESPAFCNAICHSPMDPYVESYESGDESLMVTAHAREGYTCLQCHEDPLPKMEYDETFCLNEACHDMDRAGLEALTDGLAFNPHQNRHGDIACGTCHSAHGPSDLYCGQCHEEAAAMAPGLGWTVGGASL